MMIALPVQRPGTMYRAVQNLLAKTDPAVHNHLVTRGLPLKSYMHVVQREECYMLIQVTSPCEPASLRPVSGSHAQRKLQQPRDVVLLALSRQMWNPFLNCALAVSRWFDRQRCRAFALIISGAEQIIPRTAIINIDTLLAFSFSYWLAGFHGCRLQG